MSVRAIAHELGVSKGSVSTWVRDIILSGEQVQALSENQKHYAAQNRGAQTNREKHRQLRMNYQEAGRSRARQGSPLHMAGCMLYWAEGAKKRNHLYFVNSDPNMMTLFMRFLREELMVQDEDCRLYIHCHTNAPEEIARIENYWLQLLSLPDACLAKTQIKAGSDSRHNMLENGVCGIGVNSTELTHHIYGAIQEYGGFDKPEWLF